MPDVQLTWTERELLANHDVVEPLVAGGVRCHGGFDETGRYVSPRTLNRSPAIVAWQDQHRATFGTDLLDIRRRQPDAADAEYRTALALDPNFVPALVNLADLDARQAVARAARPRARW